VGPPADDVGLHGIGVGDDFGKGKRASRFLFASTTVFDRGGERGFVVVERSSSGGRLAVLCSGASVCGTDFTGFAFVAGEVHTQSGLYGDFLFLCDGENLRDGGPAGFLARPAYCKRPHAETPGSGRGGILDFVDASEKTAHPDSVNTGNQNWRAKARRYVL
jgi:hypothetical protein